MTLPSPLGIVGLGLMGGSLARALARIPNGPEVVAWSQSSEDLELATDMGVVKRASTSAEEVAGTAALLVYAVPLGAILKMLDTHNTLWRPDAVITDVASLKSPVVAAARESGMTDRFVGSHPMTGGEASGFRASSEDLYQNVPVWIAKDTGTPLAHQVIESLWRAVGARPERVASASHDERMVWASHLPQLTSNALADILDAEGLARTDLGPGGRDMTRLAASSPTVWADLLRAASPSIAKALEALASRLSHMAHDLEAGRVDDVAALMDATRRWREVDSGDDSDTGAR